MPMMAPQRRFPLQEKDGNGGDLKKQVVRALGDEARNNHDGKHKRNRSTNELLNRLNCRLDLEKKPIIPRCRSLDPFNNNKSNNGGKRIENASSDHLRVPALPTLPSAALPTLPIDAVNAKHDRKLQLLRADLLLSRVRLLNRCEGQLKNYFQKCRCRWCRHVTGASSCTWCKRHLTAFNANQFEIKDDIVLIDGEGGVIVGGGGGSAACKEVDDALADGVDVDAGGIIRGMFPCQTVKRGIPDPEDDDPLPLPRQRPHAAERRPVVPTTTTRPVIEIAAAEDEETAEAEPRATSSGYGSIGVRVGSPVGSVGDDGEIDDSPPIYFTAEPRDSRGNVSTPSASNTAEPRDSRGNVSTPSASNCDNAENDSNVNNNDNNKVEMKDSDGGVSGDCGFDNEGDDEALEKILQTYELIDLSELYLPPSSTESTPKASRLTTPSTPARTSPALKNARNNDNNDGDRYRRSASASTLTSLKKSGSACPRSQQLQQNRRPSKLSRSSTASSTNSSSTLANSLVNSAFNDASRIAQHSSSDSLANNRHAFNRSPTDRRKKLLLLGAEGVGKSALATQLTRQGFEPRHLPSFIDFVIKEDFEVDGKTFEVQLSDSKGYEEQLSLWPENFLSLLDGIVVVYSLDKENSLEMAESLVRQLNDGGFPFVPKFLVCNKIDIVAEERRLSAEDGRRKAESLNIPFLEATAIGTDSVVLMFREIVRYCDEDDQGGRRENRRPSDDLTAAASNQNSSWFSKLKSKLQNL